MKKRTSNFPKRALQIMHFLLVGNHCFASDLAHIVLIGAPQLAANDDEVTGEWRLWRCGGGSVGEANMLTKRDEVTCSMLWTT